MVLDLQTDKQVFLHRHPAVFQMPLKSQVLKVPLSKLAKTKDQNLSAIWVEVLPFGKFSSNEKSSLVRINVYTHCSFFEALNIFLENRHSISLVHISITLE